MASYCFSRDFVNGGIANDIENDKQWHRQFRRMSEGAKAFSSIAAFYEAFRALRRAVRRRQFSRLFTLSYSSSSKTVDNVVLVMPCAIFLFFDVNFLVHFRRRQQNYVRFAYRRHAAPARFCLLAVVVCKRMLTRVGNGLPIFRRRRNLEPTACITRAFMARSNQRPAIFSATAQPVVGFVV